MCILVAGVALGDIDLHFAWQAWHLWHWTGTGGALGYFGRGSCLRGRHELGDIDRHFAWKAWHWATSTCILRRRRGLSGTGLVARLGTLVAAAVCVAGVALGDIDRHFAWQAWHLATSTCILRGRRGTSVTGLGVAARLGTLVAAAVCMPGVALGDIDCGRPGTWPHRCAFCVAGVALGDIDLHFAWQAWHLWHWTGTGGALGYFGRGSCLRGRREHRPSLCVEGVALGDIDVHSASQAWPFWHWTGGALGYFGRGGCLRATRGTWRH